MTRNSLDKKVLIVTGATASGKTSLAHIIAKQCGGEIIMADSMKVYRHADILTSKPPPKYLKEVKYHLIDVISPNERYDAGKFCRDAGTIIDSLHKKAKMPVVAGGTALYVTSLMEGIADIPPLREDLQEKLKLRSTKELYGELKEKDPERAARLHPNMRKRIMRALGVVLQEGRKMSTLLNQTSPPPYDFIAVTISWSRDELYRRINERAERMAEKEIIEEVQRLYSCYGCRAPVFEGVGYREMLSHIKGKVEFNEALEELKKNTRNYARRQLSWWRNKNTAKLKGKKLKKAGVVK